MIKKWTGLKGFQSGIVLDNDILFARILGRGDLNGMMPDELRLKGGENLIQVSRQNAMRVAYPEADVREQVTPGLSEVFSGDGHSTLRQVWQEEAYQLTSLVTMVADETILYYDFEVEALSDFERLPVIAAISSKFNFNRFAVGNPPREFSFGSSDFFSDWAAVWSEARGEGLLLVVDGPGVFELQTRSVSWAFEEYATPTRFYEGAIGNFWQIKCNFLLDSLSKGEKRRFGWRLSHLGEYSPQLFEERCQSLKQKKFFDIKGKGLPLIEITPGATQVGGLRNMEWSKERSHQCGVPKVAHVVSMPPGEWNMEEGHPWKLPFLTYEHFREGIDRACDLGFNTFCLWDGTYALVDDETKKRAIRYAHAKGLKAWYMASLPYGTNTYPYFLDNTRNSMPLVKLAIDKFCSADLGDEALDGFGWDWEEVPSPFLRGYGYHDGLIRADEQLVQLYESRLGESLLDSSLDEVRQGYAQLWGEWFGEVYQYLKEKNEAAQLFVLAGWYDKYLSRAITSNCPGVHIPEFSGGEGAARLQGHAIKAWHNAGANVSILHRPHYFEGRGVKPTEIDGVIKEAMMAGADGLFYFCFSFHTEEADRLYAEAMNKYFPGDMSLPLAEYPINPELPEYEDGGLSFENVGDTASLTDVENTGA